jgi:hypothetical protein
LSKVVPVPIHQIGLEMSLASEVPVTASSTITIETTPTTIASKVDGSERPTAPAARPAPTATTSSMPK